MKLLVWVHLSTSSIKVGALFISLKLSLILIHSLNKYVLTIYHMSLSRSGDVSVTEAGKVCALVEFTLQGREMGNK